VIDWSGRTRSNAEDDYPPFCIDTAERVVAGSGQLGIVLGGPGNGEQIRGETRWPGSVPRWPGARRRPLAREHNDANVISIGARMHPATDAERFVDIFVGTPFSGKGAASAPDPAGGRLRDSGGT